MQLTDQEAICVLEFASEAEFATAAGLPSHYLDFVARVFQEFPTLINDFEALYRVVR